MVGLSTRKQNGPFGAEEDAKRSVVEDEQNDIQMSHVPALESGQEDTPHLEGILDKISTIMSEPSESKVEGLERADRALLEPDQALNSGEGHSGSEDALGTDGFVPSEPINLLAPYSEVLNDVRDYFKDKHSLDPNDGLLEAGQETLFQTQPVFQPEVRHDDLQQAVQESAVEDRFGLNSDVLKSDPVKSKNEIFTPVEFEQALGGPTRGEIAPLSHGGDVLEPDVAAFRRELMDRICQMEQVIGHHFGTQKSLVQDAAKAAVTLTLDAIDETPIGHRLTELETSLEQLKTALNQAGDLQALGDQVGRQNGEKNSDDSDLSERQKQDELMLADQLSGSRSGPDKALVPDVDRKNVDDKQEDLPPPLCTVSEGGAGEALQDEGVSFERIDTDGVPDRAMETSETKLKEMLQQRQQAQNLVRQEEQMVANKKGQDSKPNDIMQDQNDIDPFLSKSSDLRAQFNRSKIVSNDDDLQTVQQKGARPAFIIITIAFIIAAIGISLGNRPLSDFSFEGLFKSISGWTGSSLDKKHSSKDDTSALEEGSSKGEKKKAQILIQDGDVNFTGNIHRKEGLNTKINQRLSHSEKARGDGFEIDPETLLPSASSKLSLPPALIGPYSLRHAAAKGDASAQYEVARRFGLGQGVEQDFEKAVMWYMQAAAQGFAPAQYRLATLYERGRGVEKSLQRAMVWYQRAAQLGNVKAMHNLAVVSTALDRNNPNYQAAVYWFKQAASYNLADSQFNLAILYQNGVGVPQNLVEAYRWFSLAARQGDLDAARRKDLLEKKLKKKDLLLAHNMLQAWKPLAVKAEANKVGLNGVHVTSTMSHADETVQRSRILTAQVLLRKLGYDLKEADGTLNDKTIAAIKKFEKDKGLPITGKVNLDLIKILNKVAL